MITTALDRHIEIDPEVAGGKPRIAGHRITVQDVVVWHERLGQSVDEIAAAYDLNHAGIHAALAYYFDHRQEIDDSLQESAAWIERLQREIPSKVRRYS
jgi:uncharacterized protein (DUF433 family)